MSVSNEFKDASARACIRALRSLEQTAIMLETYGPEIFPDVTIKDGVEQMHFGRVIMVSAAETIRQAWKDAIREVEHFPDDDSWAAERGKLRAALIQIAGMDDYPDAARLANETLNAGSP